MTLVEERQLGMDLATAFVIAFFGALIVTVCAYPAILWLVYRYTR